MDLFKQSFLIKPVQWGKYLKKKFPPQSEPRTAKQWFSGFFQHIWGNLQRISLFSQNLLSQKGALKYSESLFFLTCLKRVNPEENLDLFKQTFLIKPVK